MMPTKLLQEELIKFLRWTLKNNIDLSFTDNCPEGIVDAYLEYTSTSDMKNILIMKPYFIAYEVVCEERESLEDFEGQYEDTILTVKLKSNGNTTKISTTHLISETLNLLKIII